MLSWSDEMDQMLAAFDRQAKYSLRKIKMALKHDGLPFNAGFKKYFLQASNTKIKETYDQFEIISMFEDQVNVDAYGSTSKTDLSQLITKSHDFNGIRNRMDDPVEIIESSDEEDQPENRIKMETSETPFGSNHGETFQLNDVFENDDDGSYSDELPVTKLIGIDYNGEVSNEGNDNGKKKAASAITSMIAVDDLEIDSTNKRTVTSSKASKVIDNTTGRSTDDDGSYADELPDTNSIGIDYHEEVSKNEGHDSSKNKAVGEIEVEDNTPSIVVDDRQIDSTNKRIFTVTSNNGRKIVNGVKSKNIAARLTKFPREGTKIIFPKKIDEPPSHTETVNKKKKIPKVPKKPPGKYRCDICGETCTNKWNLGRHMRNKHKKIVWRFVCINCETSYITESNFNNHSCAKMGATFRYEPFRR